MVIVIELFARGIKAGRVNRPAGPNSSRQVAGCEDNRSAIRQIGDLGLAYRRALIVNLRSPCSHNTSGWSSPRERGARG